MIRHAFEQVRHPYLSRLPLVAFVCAASGGQDAQVGYRHKLQHSVWAPSRPNRWATGVLLPGPFFFF